MTDIISLDEPDYSNIINFDKHNTSPISNVFDYNVAYTDVSGNSLVNDYIPFIAPFIGQLNKFEGIEFLMYGLFYNRINYVPNYIANTSSYQAWIDGGSVGTYSSRYNDRFTSESRIVNRRRTRRVRNPETGRLEESARNRAIPVVTDATEVMFELKKIEYADVFYALSKYIIPRIFETKEFMFQVAKGILFEFDYETKECYPLLVLAIRSSYYKQAKQDNIAGKLNLSNFALFIDNSFKDDDTYKLVYKKLKKDYIDKAEDCGIDIIYTNSIEDRLYRNGCKKPKFKNINEMNSFLANVNSDLHNYLKIT